MPSSASRRTMLGGVGAALALAAAAPASALEQFRTDAATPLYSKARTRSKALTTVPAGTVLTPSRTLFSWIQTSYSGRTGWVQRSALTKIAVPTPTPSPAPAPKPTTAYKQVFSAAGRSSTYHIVADGVDFTKPWSFLWYLDGDSASLTQSTTVATDPTRPAFKALVAEATRRNLVLVAPTTPLYDSSAGYTWWKDPAGAKAWFLALVAKLQGAYPSFNRSRQWLMGFSGGAEFIAKYLLTTDPRPWFTGAGASITGGGQCYRGNIAPTDAQYTSSVRLNWHVSATDGNTANWPYEWGALPAARNGEAQYRTVGGYARTSLTVYPVGDPLAWGGHVYTNPSGVRLYAYDLAGILAKDLNAAGIARLR